MSDIAISAVFPRSRPAKMQYPDITPQLRRLLKRSYGRVRAIEAEAGLPQGQLSRIAKGLNPRDTSAFHRALVLLGEQPETLYRQAVTLDPETLLESLPRPEQNPRWLLQLRRVARRLDSAPIAEPRIEESHDKVLRELDDRLSSGDVESRGRWLRAHLPATPHGVKAAVAFLEKQRHEEATGVAQLSRVIALSVCPKLSGSGASEAFAQILNTLAGVQRDLGQVDLSTEVLLLSIPFAKRAGQRTYIRTLARVAYTLQNKARHDDALAVVKHACALAGELGDLQELARLLAVRASICLHTGRYGAASSFAEQAMAGLSEDERSAKFQMAMLHTWVWASSARRSRDPEAPFFSFARRAVSFCDPSSHSDQSLLLALRRTRSWVQRDYAAEATACRQLMAHDQNLVSRISCTFSLLQALLHLGKRQQLRVELCKLLGLAGELDRSSNAEEVILDLYRSDPADLSCRRIAMAQSQFMSIRGFQIRDVRVASQRSEKDNLAPRAN